MTALYARLDRASPYVLSILRIITGLLFLQHGSAEIFLLPFRRPPYASSPIRTGNH
jgi:uncharacterized membrane protein YphA (DoxX/SURF4 family)